jgi:3-methyladenine DNA glycosylase AlkD
MNKRAAGLVAEVRAYCREHENPAMAGKWARYFSEGYDAWGLLDKGNPFFTVKKEEWLAKYGGIGLKGFLKAGAELCKSGKYEEASISIGFVKAHREELGEKDLAGLARWFDGGIRNWAHVDVLCMEVLAPLAAAGRISLEALGQWRVSEWKYQRRASVVALIPPPKDAKAIQPLLEYVRPLMEDPEKPVQQAMGWFLREAWKVAPKPVEAFLLKHLATAPRQIVQTATEKMTAEQKARFKRPPAKKAK